MCWGPLFPLPSSYCGHQVLEAGARAQLPVPLERQEWCSGFPSSQDHLLFGLTGLGTWVSLFPCLSRWLGIKVTLTMFWYFLSFLGTQGNGRQIRGEGEQHPNHQARTPVTAPHPLYLVGLLPAASLGVHVYRIFGLVSLNIELLSNLVERGRCKRSEPRS